MEIVDNAIMLVDPRRDGGGTDESAVLGQPHGRAPDAAVVAFPVNRWLISRGRGHAVVHAHHGH